MQVNDRGKRPVAVGLGQIAVDDVRRGPARRFAALAGEALLQRPDEVARAFKTNPLGRGRGVCMQARSRDASLQLGQLTIFRTEIVSPMADAMGFIDREGARTEAFPFVLVSV